MSKYKFIELDNKLKILIVNSNSSVSAACLTVGIGSIHEPTNLNGLAHFLEHMLFMGNEKYPEPSEFFNYIKNNGGYRNAQTKYDKTSYMFSINDVYFDKAIDIFSHFFISPNLDKNHIDKEINAVHSEYIASLNRLGIREWNIMKKLMDKNNPLSRFTSGNIDTLKKDIVYDELKNFYSKYYSSNIMNLVIITKRDYSDVKKIVKKLFGQIKNKNINIMPSYLPIFKNESRKIYTESVSSSDLLSIRIQIKLKGDNDNTSVQSAYFLLTILNSQENKSFYDYMKKKGYINDVYFDFTPFYIYNVGMITCRVSLTKKGIQNYVKVIRYVLQYYNYINSFNKSFFDTKYKTISKINKLNYAYEAKDNPIYLAQEISENMIYFNKNRYVIGNRILTVYNYNEIKNILYQLTGSEISVLINSRLYKDKFKKYEKYYNIPYGLYKFNKPAIKKESKLNKFIKLYNTNKYIPTDLQVIVPEQKYVYPIALIANDKMEVWIKQNYIYNTPKVMVYISLTNPIINIAPVHLLYSYMLTTIINTKLLGRFYSAYNVGYDVYARLGKYGINFIVSGFLDKIGELVKDLFDTLKNIDIQQFSYETALTTELYINNKNNINVAHQSIIHFNDNIKKNKITFENMNDAFSEASYKDFIKFKDELLHNFYLKMLYQGNITRDKVNNIISSIYEFKTVKKPSIPGHVTLKGSTTFESITFNNSEKNSYIACIHQLGKENDKLINMADVLYNMISPLFFHQLRTTEQLGYIVHCRLNIIDSIVYLIFIIQSSCKKPHYLQKRIDVFLENFKLKLNEMNSDQFRSYVNPLIHENTYINYIDLQSEFNNYYPIIDSNNYIFNQNTKNLVALEQLTLEDISSFYEDIVNKKRNFNIHIIAQIHSN